MKSYLEEDERKKTGVKGEKLTFTLMELKGMFNNFFFFSEDFSCLKHKTTSFFCSLLSLFWYKNSKKQTVIHNT